MLSESLEVLTFLLCYVSITCMTFLVGEYRRLYTRAELPLFFSCTSQHPMSSVLPR